MAENAGAIKYNIEAETNDLLSAEKSVSKSVDSMTNSFKKVDVAAKKTSTQITKTSKAVKTGVAGMGRGFGQAGIQVQQFVGQIQGGQSALLAFSQQGADLGIVLGAPLAGAIIGISASLVSFLIPSLGDSTKNVKELTDSLKPLIDNFAKLSDSQKLVTRTALTEQLKKQKREANELQNTINELQTALIETERASGGRFFDRLLGGDPVKAREDLAKAKATLTALNLERAETLKQLRKLNTEEAQLTKEEIKLKEATEGLSQSLKAQIIALKDGSEAAFRFSTAQQLGLKVGEQIPADIDAQITALFKLKKAQKDAAQEKTQKRTLETQVSVIGLTPEQVLIERFQKQNELLKQAKEKDLLTEQEFLSRSLELQKQHDETVKSLREKSTIDAIINFEALENQIIGTFASVIVGAQNGREAMLGLANSVLNEAVGSLIKMGLETVKNTILGETLEKAKQAGIVATSTVDQTATAASTATKIAGETQKQVAMKAIALSNAAAHTAAITATVAELVSLAATGAFAATAAIPIVGPFLAPAAAAAAGGIAGGLGAGAIAAAPLAGMRKHGGPVSAGGLYQVGEGGDPEIFTSGGKNFMIPGDNGQVTSNKNAFGGVQQQQQVQMNVNIENNVSNANVQTSMSEDGRMLNIFINEFSNQVNTGQGKIMKAFRNSTNLTQKANR